MKYFGFYLLLLLVTTDLVFAIKFFNELNYVPGGLMLFAALVCFFGALKVHEKL